MRKGYPLVELVIAIAIILIATLPLVGAIAGFYRQGSASGDRIQAVFLAQEAMEAAYNVLGNHWEPTKPGEYYPRVIGSGKWQLHNWDPVGCVVDGFKRKITISYARRDGENDLDPSGVKIDEKTKKVEVEVVWGSVFGSQEVELNSYYSEVGVVE